MLIPVFLLWIGAAIFFISTIYYAMAAIMLPCFVMYALYKIYAGDDKVKQRKFWNGLPVVLFCGVLTLIYVGYYTTWLNP